ncbi:acetylglutamate kinase [Reichenbachiella carrageenanivorans]|uniref:Acetylglutamate kinase n=1 Tax=Reichenbachiella carrageenanivorans TaxID=2979869 RepID=A0ABY6CXZ2_9BACT|nr:acetylglutamate kinase [Reichenbachiella carrageenanivorans]UXX78743.1 acetylglutamate kinase [Reichenbachiella carrageenanivorans]
MEKLTVVKIGGKVINEEAALDAFLKKFALIKGKKILIHGGGNIASDWQRKMGVEPKMIQGRRITDKDTIEVVTMIYAGLNKKIVAKLQGLDNQAIGLSGADLNVIKSHKRMNLVIDYGYVGDIEGVNAGVINALMNLEATPVVCALTHDNSGQLLNTNADTIASAVATGMSESYDVDLVYCFEQPGVLSDFENKIVIPVIVKKDYDGLKNSGTISDGMIPKIDNAFAAIDAGVGQVKICHFDAIDTVHAAEYSGTVICQK